ncbi:uroporphyrinogen-III synthase [Cellulomonas sp. HZM]|uniref:uroporphyrinogen-III synthase n=1 Tax=Cellulomonas sp. HZM TaxID=1454010 RepID=UPI00068CA3D4|nr:uroporphyrinogen-III synthase [Cellulomonas sp. HZM]
MTGPTSGSTTGPTSIPASGTTGSPASGTPGSTSPLAGWRVLVPRPAAGSSPAQVALAAAGAHAELVPLVQTVPAEGLDDVVLALGAGWYRSLVVTSAAAVPVLVGHADDAGRTLADVLRDGRVQVAAVGPGTARALEAADVAVDLIPRSPSTAASLVAAWPDASTGADDRPARVLFPRGDLAAPTLAEGLRAKGWQVDDVVAYRTVPAQAPDEVRTDWREGRFDAALLTSASTVREIVAQLGAPPPGTLLVAIGPTTAAEARAHGLELAATADTQTMSGLVDALARATTSRATTSHQENAR